MNDQENTFNMLPLQQALDEEPNVPVVVQTTPHEPKLPDVGKFNGNPKTSFQFLSQLNVFFHLQPIRFKADLSKCYYFGLRCEDSAAVWFNLVLIGPDAVEILSNYEVFVAAFKQTFDDPTRILDAERKLLTMKQGKRSVAQTIPEFKINVFVAGWQDENLYRIFLNILNEDVRDELLREERPDTLQRYMERAIIQNFLLNEKNSVFFTKLTKRCFTVFPSR
jgi:hypothetical protein